MVVFIKLIPIILLNNIYYGHLYNHGQQAVYDINKIANIHIKLSINERLLWTGAIYYKTYNFLTIGTSIISIIGWIIYKFPQLSPMHMGKPSGNRNYGPIIYLIIFIGLWLALGIKCILLSYKPVILEEMNNLAPYDIYGNSYGDPTKLGRIYHRFFYIRYMFNTLIITMNIFFYIKYHLVILAPFLWFLNGPDIQLIIQYINTINIWFITVLLICIVYVFFNMHNLIKDMIINFMIHSYSFFYYNMTYYFYKKQPNELDDMVLSYDINFTEQLLWDSYQAQLPITLKPNDQFLKLPINEAHKNHKNIVKFMMTLEPLLPLHILDLYYLYIMKAYKGNME